MQEKINDLLMKELSGFFDKLILDMENSENEEGFTRDTIMKSAEEYFNTSKTKNVKAKVVKEKKQVDQLEQCVALKKDGTQCSKKRTNKVEYQNTEIENLCTSHITIHLKNKTEATTVKPEVSNVDEIDPPFEVPELEVPEKIQEPKKKTKKPKSEKKETITEDEL